MNIFFHSPIKLAIYLKLYRIKPPTQEPHIQDYTILNPHGSSVSNFSYENNNSLQTWCPGVDCHHNGNHAINIFLGSRACFHCRRPFIRICHYVTIRIKLQVHTSAILRRHWGTSPTAAQGDRNHPVDVAEGDGHSHTHGEGGKHRGDENGQSDTTDDRNVSLFLRVIWPVVLLVHLNVNETDINPAAMYTNASYFITLLCLTAPDDFTRHERLAH